MSEPKFQAQVFSWMMECFGADIANDKKERNHRFLEESLELVQACGCTASEAHQLVDYVFNRPVGEKHQEVGGVMVTLAALCIPNLLEMHMCGEEELARVWENIEVIRAKQANKPAHSPLPEHSPNTGNANSVQVGGDHYRSRAIQPWDFVAANNLDFFQGNIVKYVTRWKDKGGIADLEKSRHYLDKYLEVLNSQEGA